MNRRLLSIALSLALAAGALLVSSSPASSTVERVSKTFSGFAFEKTIITPSMKVQIKAWVAKNPNYTSVSCFGYTGYNVKKRTQQFLNRLAVQRAKKICALVNSIDSGVAIASTGGIPSSSKDPNARRVTVTLSREAVPSDGGSGDGTGTSVVGTCDNNITAKMKSRLLHSDLYFNQIILSAISTTCNGKYMDVYFMDASGSELANVMNKKIVATSITLLWSDFSTTELLSTTIAKVAISIHD